MTVRRARQVVMTLALLDVFRAHGRGALAVHDPTRGVTLPAGTRQLMPKDGMSFDLEPFNGLDARLVVWLWDEYGGGTWVLARTGWKDLVGLILDFG